MRVLTTYLKLSVLASATAAATTPTPTTVLKCNADNCLRQIRATSPTTRSLAASRDCISFMASTVTRTLTSTSFSTVTITVGSSTPAKREVVVEEKRAAPLIPAYASSCSNTAAYISACSCAGYTVQPSTTTTIVIASATTTATVTTTAATTSSCSIFRIQATAGAYAGHYFSGSDSQVFLTTTDSQQATLFVFRGRNIFQSGTDFALEAISGNDGGVYLDAYVNSNPQDTTYVNLSCSLAQDSSLTCTNDEPAYFYSASGGNTVAIKPDPSAGDTFVPKAIFAC